MITIFSRPTKNNIYQRNAVNSWLSLRVDQEIILYGDNSEVASAVGAFYVKDPSEYGKYPITLLVDPHVIIFDSLIAAITIIADTYQDGYLIVGSIIKYIPERELDFTYDLWDLDLIRDAKNYGRLCSGIGYYVFPKGMNPDKVMGRSLIEQSLQLGVPVIDVTPYAPVVFQGIAPPPMLLNMATHRLTQRGIIEPRR